MMRTALLPALLALCAAPAFGLVPPEALIDAEFERERLTADYAAQKQEFNERKAAARQSVQRRMAMNYREYADPSLRQPAESDYPPARNTAAVEARRQRGLGFAAQIVLISLFFVLAYTVPRLTCFLRPLSAYENAACNRDEDSIG
jgi:hypothetical protein